MKIRIRAKPNSNEEAVVLDSADGVYIVSVKEPPVQGRANQAIIKMLAEYFNVSKSQIRIISGWKSRQKVIEIMG